MLSGKTFARSPELMSLPMTRRRLLRQLALGATVPLAAAAWRTSAAADTPLLAVDAAEAKAVKYVENAGQAKDAQPGSTCANCGLYQGPEGSSRGPCMIFPGKDVKAAGWCTSWAAQM
jgi:hypothetical protein